MFHFHFKRLIRIPRIGMEISDKVIAWESDNSLSSIPIYVFNILCVDDFLRREL